MLNCRDYFGSLTCLLVLQTSLNLLNYEDQEQDVFSVKEQATCMTIIQEQQNSMKQLVLIIIFLAHFCH